MGVLNGACATVPADNKSLLPHYRSGGALRAAPGELQRARSLKRLDARAKDFGIPPLHANFMSKEGRSGKPVPQDKTD
jgi:hypothetical protein